VVAGASTLALEPLTVRGRYRVLLGHVTDAQGCHADLAGERTVWAERVSASLVCGPTDDVTAAGRVRAGEGGRLAVAIAGGVGPYHVDYQAPIRIPNSSSSSSSSSSGSSGSSHSGAIVARTAVLEAVPYGLPLTVSGAYTLVGVRDAACVGVIEAPATCVIDVVARPTLVAEPGVSQGTPPAHRESGTWPRAHPHWCVHALLFVCACRVSCLHSVYVSVGAQPEVLTCLCQ
jgi:hypothetical protein